MLLPGDKLNSIELPRLIAYDDRTTPSGPSAGTEVPVFRFDNVPVIADHLYEIKVSNINADGDTAGQIAMVRLRLAFSATTGTAATTSSTQRNTWRQYVDDATNSNITPWTNYYPASTDGYLSILWSLQRQGAASGNVVWFCSATDIAEFTVVDLGERSGVVGGTIL